MNRTVRQIEEQAMEQTWIDFCKETNQPQDGLPFEQGDWFAWLDFAAQRYCEPLPAASGMQDWVG